MASLLTRTIASLFLLGVASTLACSSDDSSRGFAPATSTTNPTDVEHPTFRLYPDTVLVGREAPEAIYDIRVLKDELRLPAGKYDALLAKLVNFKSVMVGRANEDDFAKNGGFVRGVVSVETQGNEVVIKTKPMRLSGLVNGFLPFAAAKYYHAGTHVPSSGGVSPAAANSSGSLKPQGVGGSISTNLFDLNVDVPIPPISIDATKYTIPEAARTDPQKGGLSLAGKIDLAVHVAARMDATLGGGVDFGWDSNGGFCVDPPFIDKVCTGAPRLSGEANLLTEYDFSALPSIAFTGALTRSIQVSFFNIEIACEIPPGLPCFFKGNVGADITLDLNGSISLVANKPFRMSGTPQFGAKFKNTDVTFTTPSAPLFDAPTGLTPGSLNVSGADYTNISHPFDISMGAELSVGVGPSVTFGIGEDDLADIHLTLALDYRVGAFAQVCIPLDQHGVVPGQTIGIGGSLKRGPEATLSIVGEAGPLSASSSIPLYSGYGPYASFGAAGCGGVPPDGHVPTNK